MSRYLLDTHVALWWFTAHPRLTEAMRQVIATGHCHLSTVSVWEVAIKYRLGKLPVAPDAFWEVARRASMPVLPVLPQHAVATATLPSIHGDPFDRLLIAQARLEGLTLLTLDQTVARYGAWVRGFE